MTEADEAKATTTTSRAKKPAVDDRTVIQRMLDIAAQVGVLEPSKSGGVPFAFRGVDATVAHLTPMLIKHGVLVVPHVDSHLVTQREAGAKVITKTEVEVTYRFFGPAGDSLEVRTAGQADDFADRSTAQAMSVAYRIALLQAFHIAAFGNEEAFSEGVKNDREAAGNAAVNNARSSAPAASAAGVEHVRQAILAEAAARGLKDGDAINKHAATVTDNEDWFNSLADLNKILSSIKELPEA